MTGTNDQLIDTYLDRLEAELGDLPRARRRELVDEIAGHIAEARAHFADATEADVRTLLDRLGDPADIAAEARGRPVGAVAAPRRPGAREIAAVILLPIGGVIVPFAGWLVGAVLLWASDAWSTRDKLIGTLVFPGGLAAAFAFAVLATSSGGRTCVATPASGVETCTNGGGASALAVAGAIVLFAGPIASAAYLAFRLRRSERRARLAAT